MKKKKEHKIRIYQDSKELPFLAYKRIVQTGDFYYLVKGYESGDTVNEDVEVLKTKFKEIEEDYALSINTKNANVILYGEVAVITNEFNKYNNVLLFIEQAIKAQELRLKLQELLNEMAQDLNENEEEAEEIRMLMALSSMEFSEFDSSDIKNLLEDFKIQKSDDLYEQKQFVQDRIEKLKNQLLKLNSQVEKNKTEADETEIDIEEQFVSVCLGVKVPVDDKNITLYQYGLMVKALIKHVEEINKMNRDAG